MEFPIPHPSYAAIVRIYDNQKIYIMQNRRTKETLLMAARNHYWIELLCKWANNLDPKWARLLPYLKFEKGLRDWIVLESGDWYKIIQWAGRE